MELTTGLLIIAFVFALVLWVVFSHNHKQTKQQDNARRGNSLLRPDDTVSHYTGPIISVPHHNVPPHVRSGFVYCDYDEQHEREQLLLDALSFDIAQSQVITTQQPDEDIQFIPAGGNSGGAGASDSWDESEEVAVSEPQSDSEPDNSSSED